MSQRCIYPVVSICLRMMNRSWAFLCFALLICVTAANLQAQTTNAAINGQITDPLGNVVPGTEVQAVNIDTNVVYPTKSNGSGIYAIAAVPPGRYRLVVRKDGFKEINKTDIVLHVQDILEQNFSLEVGATSESITVSGSNANVINTTDASVGTIVDRHFVENMPLNGRSLQDLISLAPGVVQTPISGSSPGSSGEFSINGQRTESNYYTVDGVSANVGVGTAGTGTAGASGSTPAQTALGTTQNLASIDALQEFKVNTSTYSAEYGRSPGGQISLETRSGTNSIHGNLFDYFRNDALDANNWFNDHTVPATAKTAERQNDFGGIFGGPIFIPHFYDGRQKSFFFYSYEGLRLQVPTPPVTVEVPDAGLRSAVPPALQSIVTSFPVANGTEVTGAPGLAYFTGGYSLPAGLDTNSIRFDRVIDARTHVFGRYSDSVSNTRSRLATDLAQISRTGFVFRSGTSGLTHAFSSRSTNDARFNYSWTSTTLASQIDTYGGASASTLSTYLPGSSYSYEQFASFLYWGTHAGFDLSNTRFGQTQVNIIDTQQFAIGHHALKVGVDYRRLQMVQQVNQLEATMLYINASQFLANTTLTSQLISAGVPPEPTFWNLSAFAQDEWRMSRRNSVSVGLRWDLNPPPSNGNGRIPPVLNQVNNLATASLAPDGTPEWNTYYRGFAPRLGFASHLNDADGKQTVLRVGGGVFYDTGNTMGAIGFGFLGFASKEVYSGLSYPLADSLYVLPAPSTAAPYNETAVGYDRNLKLPYTLEWNTSLEQALGVSRSLTLGYVGSAGRRLTVANFQNPASINPAFSLGNGIYTVTNGSWSNYHSLQAQFKQSLSHGLQALASMTWSHSIDDKSSNFFNYQPLLKGDSDFDVRLNVQAALTYNTPGFSGNKIGQRLTRDWAVDLRASSRTSEPVDVYGSAYIAADGTEQYARPNLIPGVPLYLYGSNNIIPGGRELNYNAFQAVTGLLGDAPRNFLRGFGATEIDGALRREFGATERLKLQFRAEAFNVLNHPAFGAIYNTLLSGPSQFGQSYNTLNVQLGNQSALYAQGGPRSLQLALKVMF